jgi:hypothetical protein
MFEFAFPVVTLVSPPVLELAVLPPVPTTEETALTIKLQFDCITVNGLLLVTLTLLCELLPLWLTVTLVVVLQPHDDVTLAVLDDPPTATLTLLFALPVVMVVVPLVLPLALLPPVPTVESTSLSTTDPFPWTTVVLVLLETFTPLVELFPLPETLTFVLANATGAIVPTIIAAVAAAVVNLFVKFIVITSFHIRYIWAGLRCFMF